MPDDQVSLREFIERIVAEHEKQFDQRFEAQSDSISLATAVLEKRLEGMNEFRETLRDQASRLVSKDEFMLIKDKFESDIRMLRESKAMLEGKASQSSVNLSLVISILSLLVGFGTIIAHILK